jgi:hypothetical protein
MEQYADFISRKKNFKPSVGQELKDFSQVCVYAFCFHCV